MLVLRGIPKRTFKRVYHNRVEMFDVRGEFCLGFTSPQIFVVVFPGCLNLVGVKSAGVLSSVYKSI